MQTITQIIGKHKLRTSVQPRSSTSWKLPQLTQRQKTVIEQFTATFPTTDALERFFCPAKWGYCLMHAQDCATNPCITLAQTDAVYEDDGTAQRIVRSMFIGIYSMTTAREPYNKEACDTAADLFIASYGHECTLYAMMLYFGNYLTEYKACYAQYDVQDILRQFGKFLPRWRQRLAENDQPQQVKEAAQPVGVEGLKMMLRNRLYDGETAEQLKEGYLYTAGIVTDEMLAEAVQATKDGII